MEKVRSSRKSKTNKKIGLVLAILILFSILSCFIYKMSSGQKSDDINELLETSSYSYLPKEAKNYIKKYYAETDNIILTEKNKKENEAYLNPEFVDYLTMSSYEQEKMEVIPTDLIVDSTPEAIEEIDENLPSKFDLRDIEGKNYMTPIKNQGSLGLCWAFATNAQMEAYLTINNNQPVSSSSQIFSERQIDYATSDNGIKNFSFSYANRELGRGGNFDYFMYVATSGYATKDASWDKKVLTNGNYYDMSIKKKSEIYNYSSSLYEVDESKTMPYLIEEESDINMMKHLIKKYGGMYVMTKGPSSNAYRNIYDNNYVLQGRGTDHAMQIIGWDDDYKYKYCEWSRPIEDCPLSYIEENTEGSWIIKNSWGNSEKKYLYLPYSLAIQPAAVTKLIPMADRTWDYQLDYTKLENVTINDKEQKKIVFNPPIDSRMSKLKFHSNSTNRNVKVYYKTSNGRKLIDTVGIDLKGWYTVDLYDKNLECSDKCVFHIEDPDYLTPINISNPKLFLNSDGVESITTLPVDYSTDVMVSSYDFEIESQVYGIAEGENLDYKIYDLDGKDMSQYINSYSDNVVYSDYAITSMSVSNRLRPGEYTIEIYHNGEYLDETSLMIDAPFLDLEGDGTLSNPYLIKTPTDLSMIESSLSSSYKLANDIDLTFDTQNENGMFYNNGNGWNPITNFKGTFDGNGHKIIGLYSTTNGLFDSVTVNKKNENNDIFSNLTLQDFNIVSSFSDNVSGLVGNLNADSDVTNIKIDNVSITASNISGENKAAGLVAYSNSFIPVNFTNCYSNSEIYSKVSGGIYGDLKIANVTNSVNEGIINGSNIAGGIGAETVLATLDKVVNTAKIDSHDIAGGIVGKSNSVNITDFINYGDITAEIFAAGAIGQLNNMSIDSSGNVNITGNLSVDSGYSTGNIGCLSCEGKDELTSVSTGKKYTSNCSDELVCRDSSIADLTDQNIDINNMIYFKGTIAQGVSVNNNVKKIDYIDAYDIENNFNWPTIENNWIIDNSFPTINNKRIINKVSNIIPSVSELTMNLSYNENYVIESTVEGNILNKDVVYYSDNEEILEIDKQGNITAKNIGNANIIIVSKYDGTKKVIPVTVKVSKYNIIYHSNTDDDITVNQSVIFNTNDKLLKNTFEKSSYKFSGWNTKPDGTGTNYSDQQDIFNLISEDETIDLYAVWSIDGLIKTDVYEYDIENSLIYNVGIQTTVKEFTKNTSFNSSYKYLVYDSKDNLIENNSIVTTGSYIEIVDNTGESYKIYISVRGDINNDGSISITDISRLFRYIVDDNYNIDLPNIKSSDVNDDNRITITDLSKLFAYIMKNISKL